MTPTPSHNIDDSAELGVSKARNVPWADILWFLLLSALIISNVVQPYNLADMDFFSHAAIGRWIWAHHAVPHHGLFLWSGQASWIAHSWLSELLLFGFMSVHGDTTGEWIALVWTIAMSVLMFGFLCFAYNPNAPRPLPFILLLGLGAYISAFRVVPKPELFSDLGTVLVLWRLTTWHKEPMDSLPFREGPGVGSTHSLGRLVRRGAPLVAMFALWANLHGGVLYGLVLVGLTAIGDALQDRFSAHARALGIVCVAGCLAIAINPYGAEYYTIFAHIHSLTFSYISEWNPLFAGGGPGPIFTSLFVILLGGALFAWFRTPDRRISQLLWLAFATAALLSARRNMIGFDWVCLAVIAYNRDGLAWKKLPSALDQPMMRYAAVIGVIGAFGYAISLSPLATARRPTPMETILSLPTGQATFLKESGIRGNIFSSYATTDYFEWKLADADRFFLDSMNAYPDSTMKMFINILKADPDGLKCLDDNHVNCVQGEPVEDPGPPGLKLYGVLTDSPNWSLVYKGRDGSIWVRHVPELQRIWSHPVDANAATSE